MTHCALAGPSDWRRDRPAGNDRAPPPRSDDRVPPRPDDRTPPKPAGQVSFFDFFLFLTIFPFQPDEGWTTVAKR